MLFKILRINRNETLDTGTYPDGAFELPIIDIKAPPGRLRGHLAHERDYGANRTIAPMPAGFA